MIQSKCQQIISFALTLALTTAVFGASSKTASADELTLKEIAAASRKKAAAARLETLRLIVHRQKGDELKIYINSRSGYINGKSTSHKHLAEIVQMSGLKMAVITREPYIGKEKVAGWEKAVREAGIEQIEFVTKKKRVVSSKDKLREIMQRQKDDALRVYLKGTRNVYVNGRSISSRELATLVSESGLEEVVVTAQPAVPKQRLSEIEEFILKSAGEKEIKLTMPKAN